MHRVALVEDEQDIAEELHGYIDRYCAEYNEIIEVDVFSNGAVFLENYTPRYDIILMDIMMPRLNGMEAAKKLRLIDKNVILIFMTNMAQYAVKGYEVDALSFVVKPVKYQAFAMNMTRAISEVRKRKNDYITVNTDDSWRRISTSEIRYIEVSGHTIYLHLVDGTLRIKQQSLSSLEEQLKPFGFMRCNVCYLINSRFITLVVGNSVFLGETELMISRARKKDFLRQLAGYAERRN